MDDAEEPVETIQRFFKFFQHEATALQQQMDRLGDTAMAGGERIDATSHCQAGISRLSSEVKSASVYLPAYDQRTYTVALKALQDRLEEVRATFAPKPRFAFKNIRKNNSATSLSDVADNLHKHPSIPFYGSEQPSTQTSSAADTPDETPTPDNEAEEGGTSKDKSVPAKAEASAYPTSNDPEASNVAAIPDAGSSSEIESGSSSKPQSDSTTTDIHKTVDARNIRKPSFSAAKSISITRQNGIHIILPSSAGHATTTGTLSHLKRCVVDMSVPTSTGQPFAGLTLKTISQSLLICGRVSGPIHITGLMNCIIVVSCRQFRLHASKDCDVYLRVSSKPIVEDVSGVRFAPLPKCYVDTYTDSNANTEMEGQTWSGNDQWGDVQDFKWLKKEHSPNWSLIAEKDIIPNDIWTNVVPGGAGSGVEDVLRACGL